MPKLVKRGQKYSVEFYNPATRNTARQPLGTGDARLAQQLFGEWIARNAALNGSDPWELSLDYVVAAFYESEAKNYPSHAVYKSAKEKVVKHLQGITVRGFKKSVQRKFIRSLQTEGLAPATINRLMGAVSSSIGRALEDEMVRPKLMTVTVPKANRRYLSDNDLRAILAACETENDRRWVMVSLLSGGRPGALIRLTKAQFDFTNHVLDLLPHGENQVQKKFKPTIPLPKSLEAAAASWDDGPIFYMVQSDHKVQLASCDSIWERIGKAVPWSRPYDLRRACAAEMRRQGVPMADISGYLGHKVSQARVTELYAPFDPKEMRAAADAMDILWGRISNGQVGVGREDSGDDGADGEARR